MIRLRCYVIFILPCGFSESTNSWGIKNKIATKFKVFLNIFLYIDGEKKGSGERKEKFLNMRRDMIPYQF